MFWLENAAVKCTVRLWVPSSPTAQLIESSGCVTGSPTAETKRSTLTMTERDKVRDAPSLGKQGSYWNARHLRFRLNYNLSWRDIYL
ncbi:hypothetical protein CEXT_499791 [Caerostris extrusa]|uniref:Uncharacterized protein n=1 Tax=Caerostris extrusa TaxID=172846 RepID=A0AAV4MYB9_CAEEX|nr:hypothetical protein CEXT_499791 [Caerostris extrusa]